LADDDDVELIRVQWGGSLLEVSKLEADTRIVSIAHHALEAEPAAGEPADTESISMDIDPTYARTQVVGREMAEAGVTLATAPIVFGGGRAVGSADAFAPLEECAALMGGRVGCSRAVTNNGWRPHRDQVGQTGTRIAPELYVASGISGAIQHWVGAMASKNILAINTDPEANMVVKADYFVEGDLHKVLPALAEEIKKRRA
jgi:electron transfer flavoprotein alpha subunit